MITTVSNDCSQLTFNSSSLELSEGKVFDSIKLKSRLNCSSTESTLDLDTLIDSIENNEIILNSTLFYNDETKTVFCDGVYYFQLEITYTIDSTTYIVTESQCKFIGCSTQCKALDYYIKTKDNNVWYFLYALTLDSCDSCYCTELCSLYTELKLLINDNNTSNSDNGCGCS